MGQAIADYHKHGKAAQLRVLSPVLEDDEIPVKTLFRSLQEMPAIERVALEQARGHILDVGAGAGCHSLALQGQGKPVTAIDISPVAVATMRERGVVDVLEQDFFTYDGPRFDTILMLMNGIGIVGTVSRLPAFFMQVDRLLAAHDSTVRVQRASAFPAELAVEDSRSLKGSSRRGFISEAARTACRIFDLLS